MCDQVNREFIRAADRVAAEHKALLDLVESSVGEIDAVCERIARFQAGLAEQGKHQLWILGENRETLIAVAQALKGAL